MKIETPEMEDKEDKDEKKEKRKAIEKNKVLDYASSVLKKVVKLSI